MPRKATRHTQIRSEKERISTFKRRLDSFLKKGNELSILCGIEMAILVHNHHEGYSMLWPSEDIVTSLTEKFLGFPEREMVRKMVLQESFLVDEMHHKSIQSLKLQQKSNAKETELLMYQLDDGKGLDSLDLKQLNELYNFADEKLRGLKKRNEELEIYSSPTNDNITKSASVMRIQTTSAFAANTNSTCLRRTGEDKNLNDSNFGLQNNIGFLKGTNSGSPSTDWTSSMINQEWSAYFS